MNCLPRLPRMSQRRREAQRLRILALVKGGMSYDYIAEREDVPRPEIRRIVLESVDLDPEAFEIDTGLVYAALLEPALALATDEIARGNLAGIDKLLKLLNLLDKVGPEPAAFEDALQARLRRRHAVDRAPTQTKEKINKGTSRPVTH
jgi:hypothetical protein